MTAAIVQTWAHRVTIGGVATDVIDASGSHGIEQPVGTCTLSIPLPLPAQVVDGAAVVVEASLDGAWLASPLFTGTVLLPDPTLAISGAVARVECVGPNHALTFPFGADLAFTGDQPGATAALTTGFIHLGTEIVPWYADTSPDGTIVDVVKTPTTDSSFVWIAGLHHGSNSYDTSVGTKKILKHTKVLVIQAGEELGRAFLPVSQERWDDELDYSSPPTNWDAFEIYVAADIRVADGDVTFRFMAGKKPGTADADECEITEATWQTAGKNTIRQIGRGLKKRAGFVSGYAIPDVTDIDGDVVKLGGNAFVDAGQIPLNRRDDPLAFYNRILGLFGYYDFDCGDGVTRTRPVRGTPSGTAVASFGETTNILSVPRSRQDPRRIVNAVRVTGASGTNANGQRFAYQYETDEGDIDPNPAIPDPPGASWLDVSSSLLVSNTLCQQVGEIQEANNGNADVIEWETWPHALYPSQVVTVAAPTVGFTGNLFLTSVAWSLGTAGYLMRLAGWRGVATAFVDGTDPDPDEDPDEPVARRPDTEWLPYNPLAGEAEA